MTPREIVRRTVAFDHPERLARNLPEPHGNDFAGVGMSPSPDHRPSSGVDEWGAVWVNTGATNLGEVKEFPLTGWDRFDELTIPDIRLDHRWVNLPFARTEAGDRFLLGGGVSLYERVHFIRGLENTWCDIHQHPGELGRLIDILVDMNLYAIERYAEAGADGLIFCDDWGLQDRLMIAPDSWRQLWKPRYARVFAAAHKAGLVTMLHSCGDISSILDDLIEAGLDVIQMDQQQNMGLERLGRQYRGRITFYNPVDIQNTMAHGSLDAIRAYARTMVHTLGGPEGGFIAKWYSDPKAAGHTPEAIEAMCAGFEEADWGG